MVTMELLEAVKKVMTADGQMAREVPGWSGYFVDRLGRAWTNRRHNGKADGEMKLMSLQKTWQGYRFVRPSRGSKSRRKIVIHRMVLLLFGGPSPAGKPFALHNDDDKSNNRLDNLRWGSAQDNNNDQIANGTTPRGRRFLTDEAMLLVLEDIKAGNLIAAEIARKHQIDASMVGRLAKNKLRKHLPR